MASQQADGANGADVSTYNGEPDAQGVIWVVSRVTKPDLLAPADFVDWYENIHVDEVLATGGVPGAARFERVPSSSSPSSSPALWELDSSKNNKLAAYQWLTVYAFPSVNYRFTPRFKGLDGQAKPKGDGLQRIFSKSAFATSFCGITGQRPEKAGIAESRPARFLWLATIDAAEVAASAVRSAEVAERLGGVSGVVRVQVLDFRGSSTLMEFSRGPGAEGTCVFVYSDEAIDGESVAAPLGEFGNITSIALFRSGKRYGCWM
jgi:hypothetical protein